MKRLSTVVLALALLGLFATGARAASITWDTGQPTSPAAGKINGTGTYTLGNGERAANVTMYASLAGGGQGGQVACTYSNGNWNGTITGLATGTYNVYTRLQYLDANDNNKDTRTIKVAS
jgi:hypothetical protein